MKSRFEPINLEKLRIDTRVMRIAAGNIVWICLLSSISTWQLNAQIPMAAANTAATYMRDKYVFDREVSVAKSARTTAPSSDQQKAATTSATPTDLSQKAITTWTRYKASSFSAECPPAWVSDQEGATSHSLRFHPKTNRTMANGDKWYDYAVFMRYFPADGPNFTPSNSQARLESFLRFWAKAANMQLPQQIDISEMQTIFGSAFRAGFHHPTEFNYDEENEFLLISRPNGLFLIEIDSPATDEKIADIVNPLFSSLSFQDKTHLEEIREFQRR